jgi:phosphate transport system protein
MTTHYEQELEQIRKMVFRMVDAALDAMRLSVESLKSGDLELARQVIAGDAVMDNLEVGIDDLCMSAFLVTRQPAAVDLRLVWPC